MRISFTLCLSHSWVTLFTVLIAMRGRRVFAKINRTKVFFALRNFTMDLEGELVASLFFAALTSEKSTV